MIKVFIRKTFLSFYMKDEENNDIIVVNHDVYKKGKNPDEMFIRILNHELSHLSRQSVHKVYRFFTTTSILLVFCIIGYFLIVLFYILKIYFIYFYILPVILTPYFIEEFLAFKDEKKDISFARIIMNKFEINKSENKKNE